MYIYSINKSNKEPKIGKKNQSRRNHQITLFSARFSGNKRAFVFPKLSPMAKLSTKHRGKRLNGIRTLFSRSMLFTLRVSVRTKYSLQRINQKPYYPTLYIVKSSCIYIYRLKYTPKTQYEFLDRTD